jgi:hypothetical protein
VTSEDANARMRAASGTVRDERPLVAFLYRLLRDRMSPSDVEGLLDAAQLIGPDNVAVFTNGWLALYAQDIAARLTDERSTDDAGNTDKTPRD